MVSCWLLLVDRISCICMLDSVVMCSVLRVVLFGMKYGVISMMCWWVRWINVLIVLCVLLKG